MLSLFYYVMLMLSKTTSPPKLFPSDCIPLYNIFLNIRDYIYCGIQHLSHSEIYCYTYIGISDNIPDIHVSPIGVPPKSFSKFRIISKTDIFTKFLSVSAISVVIVFNDLIYRKTVLKKS